MNRIEQKFVVRKGIKILVFDDMKYLFFSKRFFFLRDGPNYRVEHTIKTLKKVC